jgi:hypothetical protein
VAGVFLFLPLLARLRFDDLVTQAGYPGSGMIPSPAALLSLLTLKLLDKERRSHITAFDFDEALGLFAGLNVLPKKSYATDYSYRTTRSCQQGLLSRWVAALAPLLFPDAQEFCLDFHAIPFRGEPEAVENHYLPMCRSRSETEPLSRRELSHPRGCEVKFSCNFPLGLVSTSPTHLAASLQARLSLLHPGDLAVELLAKGNGCLEETQSRHRCIQI